MLARPSRRTACDNSISVPCSTNVPLGSLTDVAENSVSLTLMHMPHGALLPGVPLSVADFELPALLILHANASNCRRRG